ncbi:hypothetical protein H632_c134p3 [Helicosporidium sp. ATCC 50920]|nr:hypothetical protein H632_c134p3 [Helicosporidium sp. ATCC 50920]|eukprot:KDD76702.1 hypothetical protein H632_c134p3 [Helicosporidium sp. ATCC 50920]
MKRFGNAPSLAASDQSAQPRAAFPETLDAALTPAGAESPSHGAPPSPESSDDEDSQGTEYVPPRKPPAHASEAASGKTPFPETLQEAASSADAAARSKL